MLCLSILPSAGSGLPPVDVEVRSTPDATVGDLAGALGLHLAGRGGSLLAPTTGGQPWPAARRLRDCELRSGQVVEVTAVNPSWLNAPDAPPSAPVAIVEVLSGPDAGRSFTITTPAFTIGRAEECAVRLSDPQISRRHARIAVEEHPVITDEGSAAGTTVGAETVSRPTRFAFDDLIRLGDTTLALRPVTDHEEAADDDGSSLDRDAVTRTPRFGVPVAEAEIELPTPPSEPHRSHFPWAMMMMPFVLGASMFFSGGGARSLVFMAAWPVAMIGSHVIQRRQERKQYEQELTQWRADCQDTLAGVDLAGEAQRQQAFEDAVDAAGLRRQVQTKQLVWVRRVDDADFLATRVGIGDVPAKTVLSSQSLGVPGELRAEIREIVASRATLHDMPVVAELATSRVLAISGAPHEVDDAVRSVLMRIAISHSPFDVGICAILSSRRRDLEGVLRWLPHCRPLTGGDPSVAIGRQDGQRLLDRLGDLPGDQHVVCVIDESAGISRRALEAVARNAERLTFIWLGTTRHAAPATTGAALDLVGVPPADRPSLLLRDRGGVHALDKTDGLDLREAWSLARELAGMKDVAAIIPPDNALPGAVRIPDVVSDLHDVDDESLVVRRWELARGLRAQIGVGIDGVVSLDLREDGPHGLLAGTTGAGKSEFLQSLIVSLAANNTPQRITFLLVDYKGGAAFRECADLPHTVGYITDLTPALVQRALVSMNAELTWREHLLEEYGAKDLLALERDHLEVAPPAMLICVDEFAALLAEVPEFIEGMVSIAQRGRSLGMHMLLATQRPSGVINAQIKANTDLRIALRVASAEDSDDVIETKDAATISRRTPGRAWIRRTGHGTCELVQVAYVGAREELAEGTSAVQVVPYTAFGDNPSGGFSPDGRAAQTVRTHERTDLDRLVATIGRAHRATGRPDPRLPWLPALPDTIAVPEPRPGLAPGVFTIGMLDDPASQRQIALDLELSRSGHVLFYGASGSGKSEALRALATAALVTPAASPTLVYGVDAAGGGLGSLEELPHVGTIAPLASLERTLRLIRMMKRAIDERNGMLAAHGVASIDDLAAKGIALSRILLLIDNLPSFLDTIDSGNMMRRQHGAMFQTILQDGRRCGLHVAATTPQRSGLDMQTIASFGARVVMRMTTEDDYSMLGVPDRILDTESVPGRALFGKLEAQLGRSDMVGDRTLADAVADWQRENSDVPVSPVPMMPERVPATALPAPQEALVYLGVDAELATAVGLPLSESPLLITGRAKAGKSSVLAAVAEQLQRMQEAPSIVLIAPKDGAESVVAAHATSVLSEPAEILALAEQLRTSAGGALPHTAVLVDDVHVWEGQFSQPEIREALGALGALATDLQLGRGGVILIAAINADQMRDAAMQDGLVSVLKRGRRGALINPTDADGMFLGVDVPSYPMEPLEGVARGLLADQGTARVVQLIS